MRLTYFALMPWPYLPDDFREKNRSVWVDIDQPLFDPAKSHEVYNTYMDLLEYADTLGFDGIGVNEHHQNGYGIMPSPNIIAAALARRTKDAALVVLGNSIALYNPPVRVAEEFAMLDCISGGRLVAGFPVGTSMDTNYCYGQIPALTREKYAEAHELIIRAWTRARAVRLQRPLQQAAPRQHLAAADPAAASADPHPRRRLGRDLRLLHRQHLFATPTSASTGYIRAKALMQGYWERVAERDAPDDFALSRRLRPDHLRRRDRRGGRAALRRHVNYFYNRCLHVYPGFADAPGYRTIKTIQTGALSQYAPPRGLATT